MKMSTLRRPEGLSAFAAFFVVVEAAALIGVLEVIRRRSDLR